MSEIGKVQREAVNVIFRTLHALARGDLELARKLLDRARGLDVALVNAQLLSAISAVIDSGKSPSSIETLMSLTNLTPYEDAARRVASDSF